MSATTDCFGKQAHETRALAAAVVKKWKKPVRIYRCPYCRSWHLGSSYLGKASGFKRNAHGVAFQ